MRRFYLWKNDFGNAFTLSTDHQLKEKAAEISSRGWKVKKIWETWFGSFKE